MTDLHGKRKFAGPTPAERRKTGTDAVIDIRKLPPHKQPREYILTVTETTTSVMTTVHKYKTRQQMEQAKIDMRKKYDETKVRRYHYWGALAKRSVKLEFSETLTSQADAATKHE